MKSETGSLLPMFGGLFFVAFVMVALVADIALLGNAYRATAATADIAAEAGASWIDEASLHEGMVRLDEAAARESATVVAFEIGRSVTDVAVDISGERLCVTVTALHETFALAFTGVRSVDVSVASCAEPAIG